MTDDAAQPQQRGAGQPEPEGSPAAATPHRAEHLDLDTLSAYLDGQLAAGDRAAAAAHLATCPECGRDLAELRATVALLRGLPQYAPRRSFRLGSEHAREAARAGGWFGRLIPALPALRLATVAVAVLLVAVTAGDFVANRGAEPPRQPAPALQADSGEEREAGAPVQAPAADQDGSEAVGFAPAAAPAEDLGTESAGRASNTMDEAADSAAEGDVAPAEPTAGEAMPNAGAVRPAGEAPDSGADAAPSAASRPSGWRLAQVALGLVLLWLIVGLVGIERLRRG